MLWLHDACAPAPRWTRKGLELWLGAPRCRSYNDKRSGKAHDYATEHHRASKQVRSLEHCYLLIVCRSRGTLNRHFSKFWVVPVEPLRHHDAAHYDWSTGDTCSSKVRKSRSQKHGGEAMMEGRVERFRAHRKRMSNASVIRAARRPACESSGALMIRRSTARHCKCPAELCTRSVCSIREIYTVGYIMIYIIYMHIMCKIA